MKLLEEPNYDLHKISQEENDQVNALEKLANAKVVVNNKTIIQETL